MKCGSHWRRRSVFTSTDCLLQRVLLNLLTFESGSHQEPGPVLGTGYTGIENTMDLSRSYPPMSLGTVVIRKGAHVLSGRSLTRHLSAFLSSRAGLRPTWA